MTAIRSRPTFRELVQDNALTAWVAAMVANLAGYGGPLAIVIGMAQAGHLSFAQTSSMLGVLSISFGLASLVLSYWFRVPVITAWTTPGAAFLLAQLPHVSFEVAVFGFMVAHLIVAVIALSGLLDWVLRVIPKSIAAALLAGILFRFGVAAFATLADFAPLMLSLLLVYVVGKRWFARYAIVAVLVAGCVLAFGVLHWTMPSVSGQWVDWVWTTPQFSWQAMLSIGVPLALVTLTGQQMTGIAVLRSSGYSEAVAPARPLVATTALLSLLSAPLGNFGINLAAITAAICTEKNAHPDPDKRYITGVIYGAMNIGLGLGAGVLVGFFMGLPTPLISIIAGLALLAAIGNNLTQAFEAGVGAHEKEAALVTFLVSASGVTWWHMGSAFWAIVLGCAVLGIFKWNRKG